MTGRDTIDAGQLDRRVALLRLTTAADAFNEPVRSWTVFATRAARKEEVSDVERVRAQQAGATVTTRFQIRWDKLVATLTRQDRLTCDGHVYEISALKEIGRKEGLEITASRDPDAVVA